MRIIGGIARGRAISAPEGMNTRPTTDRVRENIFNVLQFSIRGASVLDTFAGSGALGLEALSRGAVKCTFIEKDKKAFANLKKNINTLNFNDNSIALMGDVAEILKTQKNFDLVFLDPPYNKGFLAVVEPFLLKENFLNEDALIVVETSAKEKETFTSEDLVLEKIKKYGDTAILYYKRRIL